MKTRVYRVEVLIVDRDDVGPEDAAGMLEHTKYPNWSISPRVMGIAEREVEWDDDHPLNHRDTMASAFRDLFAKESTDAE